MTFTIDYRDGDVLRWSATRDGPVCERDPDYAPTFYVAAAGERALADVRGHHASHPDVRDLAVERWRTGWREEPEPVCRLRVASLAAVTDVASAVRGWGDPGAYRPFNVDLARQFRYCLERGVDPMPDDPGALTRMALRLPPAALDDGDLGALRIDGEPAVDGGSADPAADALDALGAALATRDPDVLVVSSAELVPLLYRRAASRDRPGFELGRRPGYELLAGASTFESYGRVGHSPARYDVPGRAIVDVSNSFFWRETNLAGLFDLVERSRKPLQETAWASIGNVLTSIQIREALDRGVLVPWNAWRHEAFKPMTTLHEADRGGFTFSSDVGVQADVHELDFASLYPNVMIERNVSPETVRCGCHADREDVPGLGYAVCDEGGYVADVLEPVVVDRQDYKDALAALEADGAAGVETDGAVGGERGTGREGRPSTRRRAAALRGRADALKWILVACFGYQGFSNAKFGRIECHEAINAFAREILLEAKERLEAHGWRVVHGIVDSLWVQAIPGAEQTPLPAVAREVTDAVGVELEYEGAFAWLAFAPRREDDAGALTRYFGRRADGGFKTRGIERRQRSTPPYVERCQRTWLEALDEHLAAGGGPTGDVDPASADNATGAAADGADRAPAAVCEHLAVQLADLRAGRVDPAELVVRQRVSKPLAAYDRRARNVAALERAAARECDVPPGQDVRYVVVDDDARSAARVRLARESPDRYDADAYADLLVRAAESVCSPFGWDRERIRRYLAETKDASLDAY